MRIKSEHVLLSITAFGFLFIFVVLPIAIYLDHKDFENRGCVYTGVQKTERKVEWNVALKMSTMRTVTLSEYVCETGQGGWK